MTINRMLSHLLYISNSMRDDVANFADNNALNIHLNDQSNQFL